MMKILITTQYLDNYAGTEIVVRDLSKKFKELGNDVYIYAPIIGNIADEICANGIRVTDNILDYKKIKFDIIHAQHNITAIQARSLFQSVPMVFMSHGVLPELEQPPSIELGISKFIAVSEEVRDNLVKNYSIDEKKVEIIRNFVDTKRFKPAKPLNEKLKKILVLTNHYRDDVRLIIENVCNELDVKVTHVGRPDNPVKNVEDYINSSDLVVALGRGALEAMSCGRNIIIYDQNGADGFIDENNFYEIRKHNFSGRNKKIYYDKNTFKNELKKYNPQTGRILRNLVEKENDIVIIIKKLINIYNQVVKNNIFNSELKNKQLFKEINFLENTYCKLYNKIKEISEVSGKFNKTNDQISKLKNIIERKNLKISEKQKIIQQNEKEMEIMKNSKFWKIRTTYLKIKNCLFFENSGNEKK